MTNLVVLIISVLSASAVCSLVEAAILSLPLIKARILYENKRRGAKDLFVIKENIHQAVATIVVINNSINIIGSIFIGRKITDMFGDNWLGIASASLTFLIIIWGELIPKTIGEHYKVFISLVSAKPLRLVIFIFKPIVFIVGFITRFLAKKAPLPKVTEEEIKTMLRLGMSEGTVEMDEEMLCNRVFKLNDLKAANMMKPISKVYALSADKTLIDAKDAIIDSPFSRIIIYEKDISHILGVCSQRVLLRELSKDNYTSQLKDFAMRPIFVKEDEKADTLLGKFQFYHQHLFIVQDAKGNNVGLITMEDVMEELFGEIYDEKDFINLEKKE